jgi:hypothetical protein
MPKDTWGCRRSSPLSRRDEAANGGRCRPFCQRAVTMLESTDQRGMEDGVRLSRLTPSGWIRQRRTGLLLTTPFRGSERRQSRPIDRFVVLRAASGRRGEHSQNLSHHGKTPSTAIARWKSSSRGHRCSGNRVLAAGQVQRPFHIEMHSYSPGFASSGRSAGAKPLARFHPTQQIEGGSTAAEAFLSPRASSCGILKERGASKLDD